MSELTPTQLSRIFVSVCPQMSRIFLSVCPQMSRIFLSVCPQMSRIFFLCVHKKVHQKKCNVDNLIVDSLCGSTKAVTGKSTMAFHSSMARKPKEREKSCVAAPLRVVLI